MDTQRVVWESADVGHHWESFFVADVGENIYVNTVTGEATFDRPEATLPRIPHRRKSSINRPDPSLLANHSGGNSGGGGGTGVHGDSSQDPTLRNGETQFNETSRNRSGESNQSNNGNNGGNNDDDDMKSQHKIDFDVSSVANLRAPKPEDKAHLSKKVSNMRARNAHGFKLGASGDNSVIRDSHPYMFAPEGSIRLVWDFIIVFPMLMYLAIMTPFFMCFAFDAKRYECVILCDCVTLSLSSCDMTVYMI